MNILTKEQVAENLGIKPRTLHRYHEIAFTYVSDFDKDYPTINGEPFTRCKLTFYQTWVLRKLVNLGQKFNSRKILPDLIYSNETAFSKSAYEKENSHVSVSQLVNI
jgi:hypothetical protein